LQVGPSKKQTVSMTTAERNHGTCKWTSGGTGNTDECTVVYIYSLGPGTSVVLAVPEPLVQPKCLSPQLLEVDSHLEEKKLIIKLYLKLLFDNSLGFVGVLVQLA